jgi:hypothetical protein
MTHIPHKYCQLSSKDSAPSPKSTHQSHSIITYQTTNKTKNRKQLIGFSASLKHNSFSIICHTIELGFLISFVHKKCWTLFLSHTNSKKNSIQPNPIVVPHTPMCINLWFPFLPITHPLNHVPFFLFFSFLLANLWSLS